MTLMKCVFGQRKYETFQVLCELEQKIEFQEIDFNNEVKYSKNNFLYKEKDMLHIMMNKDNMKESGKERGVQNRKGKYKEDWREREYPTNTTFIRSIIL